MAEPIWFNCNLATAWLDDLLDHGKAQTDTFAIHVSCALQLAEAGEKLWEIFLRNSWPCVDHVHDQYIIWFRLVVSFNQDGTFSSKLQGVLDQVHKNLPESSLITYQIRQ